jgi:hypothetical protein
MTESITSTTSESRSGSSARAAPLQAGGDVPDDGYRGAYVADLARDVRTRLGRATGPGADRDWVVDCRRRRRSGGDRTVAGLGVGSTCGRARIAPQRGWVDVPSGRGFARAATSEADALWFRSMAFGDDKDQ